MKVKSVSKVENNPENFNKTALSEEQRREQTSKKNIAAVDNLKDVVDINSEDVGEAIWETAEEANAEKTDNSNKSESVFYSKSVKNTARDNKASDNSQTVSKENSVSKNTKNSDSEKLDLSAEETRSQPVPDKGGYAKNLFNSLKSSASADGREYGNSSKLNSFVNPDSGSVKNPFYSKQNMGNILRESSGAESDIARSADASDGFNGQSINNNNTEADKDIALNNRTKVSGDGASDINSEINYNKNVAGGKAAYKGEREISAETALKTDKLHTSDSKSDEIAENEPDYAKYAEGKTDSTVGLKSSARKISVSSENNSYNSVNTNKDIKNIGNSEKIENSRILDRKISHSDKMSDSDAVRLNDDLDSVSVQRRGDDGNMRSGEDGYASRRTGAELRSTVGFARGSGRASEKTGFGRRARARADSEFDRDFGKGAGSLENVKSDYKYAGDSKNRYGYEIENITDETAVLQPKTERTSAAERKRFQIEKENISTKEFLTAQAAYQNIVHRNVNDIYGNMPDLEKLIALLFRLRKLTLKKIETGLTGRYERRSADEESELVLTEVKSFVAHESYKTGRAVAALNQFLDEQERIKYCVGLSPFPIEIKEFETFFGNIKEQTEEIKSGLEKLRREEILNSIVKILSLAVLVVIFYIVFMR